MNRNESLGEMSTKGAIAAKIALERKRKARFETLAKAMIKAANQGKTSITYYDFQVPEDFLEWLKIKFPEDEFSHKKLLNIVEISWKTKSETAGKP